MVTCTFENGGQAKLRHVVVHCVVVQDGKLLLERRAAHLLGGDKWGLPGGYMDMNETAEEAALRELYEETGWRGEVMEFLRLNSRPDRPMEDRQNVALEYIVKAVEHTGGGDAESTDVQWFALDNLPKPDEFAFDHYETVQLYQAYMAGKLEIPVWRAK